MDDILSAIESGDIQAGVEYFTALSPDKHRQFMEQVASLKNETVARLLTALYPTVEHKDLKKLIKKALFHLKTQGIPIEEPVAAGESALKKVEITKEQIAFASNYDHEGIRVLLLAFEGRKKQFVFTHATERFGEGLVDMMSAPMDRKGLDGLMNDYRSRTRRPMVLVEISPSYLIYLLENASKRSGRLVEEIRGLKRLGTGLTGDVRVPSDIHRLGVPAATSETSWQQALTESMFEPFTLSWKGVEEDRKNYDSIVHPQIVLPPHIVEEKKTAHLKEFAASEKMKILRSPLSRMLEDYAYLFYRQGEYSNCAALLKTIESAEKLDAVIQFFLRKSLEQKKEAQQQTPGLIVNPYSRKL